MITPSHQCHDTIVYKPPADGAKPGQPDPNKNPILALLGAVDPTTQQKKDNVGTTVDTLA